MKSNQLERRHCKRSSGTERAWFNSREEAEAFEADPANAVYHGDIAHLCGVCGFWHLSRPEWLKSKIRPECGRKVDDLIYNLATDASSCWKCLGEPDCWMLRRVEVRTKHGTKIHLVHAHNNQEAFEKVGIDPDLLEMIARPLPN